MWRVVLHPEVRAWLHRLRKEDRDTLAQISAALDVVLTGLGPSTGRPLVDTIKSSKVKNLKELRPGSAGASEVRMLMVFDHERNLVILVGGDKAGAWSRWYKHAIGEAEERWRAYEEGEWS